MSIRVDTGSCSAHGTVALQEQWVTRAGHSCISTMGLAQTANLKRVPEPGLSGTQWGLGAGLVEVLLCDLHKLRAQRAVVQVC